MTAIYVLDILLLCVAAVIFMKGKKLNDKMYNFGKIHSDKSVKKLDFTQDQLYDVLNHIDKHKSYYVGGSLAIDDVLPDDVLIVNLNGKCLSFLGNGEMNMSAKNHALAFKIYKKYRGETSYYVKMTNQYL